jgi:hypothetical protein
MLAFRIFEASVMTRRALNLMPPQTSEVLSLLSENSTNPIPITLAGKSYSQVLLLLHQIEGKANDFDDPASSGEALRADLIQLAKEAKSQVLVLLDDVHLYDKALVALLQDWLTGFGMGTEEFPIPVIMTFARNTPAEQSLKPFIEGSNPQQVMIRDVTPFRSGEQGAVFSEDILAYERVFMNRVLKDLPPLAINPDASEEVVRRNVGRLRKYIQGIPDNLDKEKMQILGEDGQTENFLIEANDDQILQRMKDLNLL